MGQRKKKQRGKKKHASHETQQSGENTHSLLPAENIADANAAAETESETPSPHTPSVSADSEAPAPDEPKLAPTESPAPVFVLTSEPSVSDRVDPEPPAVESVVESEVESARAPVAAEPIAEPEPNLNEPNQSPPMAAPLESFTADSQILHLAPATVLDDTGVPATDEEPRPAQEPPRTEVVQPPPLAPAWRRVGAILYDLLLLAVLLVSSLMIFAGYALIEFARPLADRGEGHQMLIEFRSQFVTIALGFAAFTWAYFTLPDCFRRTATVGKLIFDIRVRDEAYRPLSFIQTNLRFMAAIASIITIGIGYVLPIFRRDHRALHDVFAKTYVVVEKHRTT